MASPSTGVNTLTGEGIGEALAGAQVVVECVARLTPPSKDKAALEILRSVGLRNLSHRGSGRQSGHHGGSRCVGTRRLLGSGPVSCIGYFRAEMSRKI